jgi:hypothetical protein
MKPFFGSPASHRKSLAWSALTLTPILLTGAVLLAAHPAASMRWQAPDTNVYTLNRTYKSGDVDRYRLVTSGTFNGAETGGKNIDVLLSILMKETTKEVKPDGTALLLYDIEQAYAKTGDEERDMTAFLPGHLVQTRDKQGRILSDKVEGAGGQAGTGAGPEMFPLMAMAFYPPKPVKIGETWKINIESPSPQMKGVKSVGSGTLVGPETLDGVKTLKVKAVTDIIGSTEAANTTQGSIKLHYEGVGNIDPTNGKLIHMSGTTNGNTPMLGNAQKMQYALDLLKGNPADAGKPGPANPGK